MTKIYRIVIQKNTMFNVELQANSRAEAISKAEKDIVDKCEFVIEKKDVSLLTKKVKICSNTDVFNVKDRLKALQSMKEKIDRTDLEGLAMIESLKLNKNNREEIEQTILEYCDDIIDIHTANSKINRLVKQK